MNRCPINYGILCKQTVTIYHKDGDTITRKIYDKAFLDFKKTVSVDKLGTSEATSFLLVIPGGEQAVFPQDKVLMGTGPGVDEVEWGKFIPSKVTGLGVVSFADVKNWNGQIVHTEAGG
jgi:hypothetical protein